ncbi:epithelial cell-transforming sequence 2 oncogene-like [Lacerta agilis]|uniref:epithelial cell-transforming sequence 2 oncogene-like n=1 Tax=Lacerta agilis TaxID=80427 RepID=UPI00141A053B|nr:epithelial cell-transforming sequence 2 oncogene-like [Lacerta agilis]
MTTADTIHASHSVKEWHLESLGLLAGGTKSLDQNQTTEILKTRFSTWTPIENKSLNNQLFQERVRLISHWFDLWTDKQRKQFLHGILIKCNKSQLKFAERWFIENIPVTKVDFTTVLPRFISLYIFSFLNAKDLCAAAQVSWHWKFLSEQDCLWMPKCIMFGWFLPYFPEKNEYSAWKQYYIACATDLDYLTPREVAGSYGALNEPKPENEDQKEKLRERCLRKIMRERLTVCKKELIKARPPWNSGFYKSGFQPKLPQTVHDRVRSAAAMFLMKVFIVPSCNGMPSPKEMLFKHISAEAKSVPCVGLEAETLPKRKNAAGSCFDPVLPHRLHRTVLQKNPKETHSPQLRLILISSHVPAYEMIVDSIKPGVIPVVYDHSGTTLESLLYYVGKALDGQTTKSIGIIADGDSRGINLLQGCSVSTKNLLKPEVKEFWVKLRSCVMHQEGGYIDIFVPLAASEAGMEVLSQLSHLTGLFFRTPAGIATGSYQHILSEWLGNQKDTPPPPSIYFTEAKLQLWLRFTELLEDALKAVRKNLRPYFCDLQKNMTGKILGQIMFDAVSWSDVQEKQRIAEVLVEGLVELSRGNDENPFEFLSRFLMKKYNKKEELKSRVLTTESNPEASLGVSVKTSKPDKETAEKRKSFARELLLSERNYVNMLEIVRDVYVKPLKAALASHRVILSYTNVQTIFSDILNILQLNRWFSDELTQRLNEWNPAQKFGDLFIQFCQQLQTYTNFYNNYAVILKTIDTCRETIPVFRAFLKRHDKTVATTMRSLQEFLLCPSKRIEEYIMLLYALRLHTPPEHTDREELTPAIKQMKQFKDYLDQLKLNVGRDDQILTTQRHIQGCPKLLKANRYLIAKQDVAQLNCCSERVHMSFRLYEHTHDISLFLFNDILVISQRSISYKPFERISHVTHQFLAVVTLHQLLVEDIPDSKYIKNAFLLQSPRCQMICSTEDHDKFIWLSALQRAIMCNIEDNVNCS